MAIAGLVLWLLTAAVGVYLLITSTRVTGGMERPAPDQAVPEQAAPEAERGLAATVAAAAVAAVAPQPETAAPRPSRNRDRFDPPSLRAAKSEPIPGMRALAEFTHPALALTGFGFWLVYTFSRDRVFAAIALGVLLGAIAAGLSWAAANARAARRVAAGSAAAGSAAAGSAAATTAGQSADGAPSAGGPDAGALSFVPRVLVLHVAGAALTLLVAALIAARV